MSSLWLTPRSYTLVWQDIQDIAINWVHTISKLTMCIPRWTNPRTTSNISGSLCGWLHLLLRKWPSRERIWGKTCQTHPSGLHGQGFSFCWSKISVDINTYKTICAPFSTSLHRKSYWNGRPVTWLCHYQTITLQIWYASGLHTSQRHTTKPLHYSPIFLKTSGGITKLVIHRN